MQAGSALLVAAGIPTVTSRSEFGAEGNNCPLLLQAAGLGHSSQPWLGGCHATASGSVMLARSVGLDVVTHPSGAILQLCLARTPSISFPVTPTFALLGVCAQLGQLQSLTWDEGSQTSWDHLAVLSVLSSPNLRVPAGFGQAGAGLRHTPPASRSCRPCQAQMFGGDRPVPSRRTPIPSLPPQSRPRKPHLGVGGAGPCLQAAPPCTLLPSL